MRISRLLSAAALLAAVFIPTQAFTQVESTPIPAPAKPNFSSMSFMIGTWSCATKSSRRPAAYMTTSKYAMDGSGYWLNGTSTTAKTAWVPVAQVNNDKMTYDSDTKRWVDVSYGTGGAYGLAFSNGWTGNKITWHDVSFAPSSDISSQTDNVVTKVSDTKMTSTSSFTEAHGGRVVTVTGTCTKKM